MHIRRILAASASALAFVGAGLVAAPPSQAVTTVTVDCATSTTENFTVTPGEQIIFDLNAACQTGLTASGATSTAALQALVNLMANLNGTGGSAVAAISGASWTVTYTAGPNSGTDTLDVSQAGITPRSLGTRALTTTNDYSMTVPGAGGPPPWLQAYGRAAGATCDAGWNPSWAQWPNNNTGGFVCVRTITYNNATGGWDTRRGGR